jgi:hypothetical protein
MSRRESVRIAASTTFLGTLLGIAVIAGCSQSSSPTPMPGFEYKATAVWTTAVTPNVTSMTIDGQPCASGQFYTIDEMFPSYEDATATFVPRNVVITTTTDTATFQINLGACENLSPTVVDTPLTMESDQFETYSSNQPPPASSVGFAVECGSCAGKVHNIVYCR